MAPVEVHEKPFRHVVMAPEVWAQLKERIGAVSDDEVRVKVTVDDGSQGWRRWGWSGRMGRLDGLPVYTDGCPCKAAEARRLIASLDAKRWARADALHRALVLFLVGETAITFAPGPMDNDMPRLVTAWLPLAVWWADRWIDKAKGRRA